MTSNEVKLQVGPNILMHLFKISRYPNFQYFFHIFFYHLLFIHAYSSSPQWLELTSLSFKKLIPQPTSWFLNSPPNKPGDFQLFSFRISLVLGFWCYWHLFPGGVKLGRWDSVDVTAHTVVWVWGRSIICFSSKIGIYKIQANSMHNRLWDISR